MREELDQAAGRFVDDFVELQPDGDFVIVYDYAPRQAQIAQAVSRAARERGVRVVEVAHEGAEILGDAPPPAVARAMCSASTVLFVVERALPAHTDAWDEMVEGGAKIYGTVGLSPEYLLRPVDMSELPRMHARTEELARLWTTGSSAHLTTEQGTDLRFSLEGSRGTPAGKLLLPDYGEAATAPRGGTAEGTVVIDATVDTWGSLLSEPIEVVIEGGRAVSLTGPSSERLWSVLRRDDQSQAIGEVAVGTSHLVPQEPVGTRYDFGIVGTAHVGFGRNTFLGGSVRSGIHLDVLMTKVNLTVDGTEVVRDGVFL